MMKFRFCILFLGIAGASAFAHGQALPAATKSGELQVGFGLTSASTDLGTFSSIQGATIFATFDLNNHLGAEADAHILRINTPNDFYEDTYLIGPRYVLHYGRFNPYAKILAGFGSTGTVDEHPFVVNTPGNYFALGFGGGVDISLPRRFNVRVDIERQSWPGFPPNGLTPTLETVGVAYRFHH
jgi:hypothetical protein